MTNQLSFCFPSWWLGSSPLFARMPVAAMKLYRDSFKPKNEMSSWWSPLHPGATWGVFLDPRWSTSSSFRFSLGQVTAGGLYQRMDFDVSQIPERNGWFFNKFGSFPLGQKVGPLPWLFGAFNSPSNVFFSKHWSTQLQKRFLPNQQRWGFGVSWRQDWRFREWKEEKPQWNTQPHMQGMFSVCFDQNSSRGTQKNLHWFTSFSIPCVSSTCNIRCKEGRHCFQRWCITWTG